ncbi:MAG: hypothetical protein FJZ01_02410 [Candidatus Sericytochromatia bacterium]|nr:hypothetical protein [Candidatus Tanganyikabacteria bacterium]
MGHNDSYQFGRTQPLGKVSFGDKGYSDQFVRTETQSLGQQKRRTAPLQVTGDLVFRMVEQADDQLRTCRIIVDKFNQRMRILQWAEEVSRSPDAAAPEPPPEPEPPKGAKKGLFGLKKPNPFAAKKAQASAAKPDKVSKPRSSVQLSPQEQALGVSISKAIAKDVEIRRRVQVAVYQYQVAIQAVAEGEAVLGQLRALEPREAFDRLEALDVAKIQGKIYPICNFHEVFKHDAELTRLFPPPAGSQPSSPNRMA